MLLRPVSLSFVGSISKGDNRGVVSGLGCMLYISTGTPSSRLVHCSFVLVPEGVKHFMRYDGYDEVLVPSSFYWRLGDLLLLPRVNIQIHAKGIKYRQREPGRLTGF